VRQLDKSVDVLLASDCRSSGVLWWLLPSCIWSLSCWSHTSSLALTNPGAVECLVSTHSLTASGGIIKSVTVAHIPGKTSVKTAATSNSYYYALMRSSIAILLAYSIAMYCLHKCELCIACT
jgi:hypothetical protein